ncbi:MAG: hypothetical protein M0R03_13115 [Novosphingobium sp.]|nr:hypothetical protein [Novosphingobium sp.]
MTEYTEKIQKLEKKIQEIKIEHAKAEEKKKNLTEEKEKHLSSLKELGVSYDDLDTKIIPNLKQDMDGIIEEIEKELV